MGKSTSCRCGESKKSKFQGTENSSCVDIVGKRRTKCPCYAIGKACDDHCTCYSCGNSYGKKEESKKDFPSRKRKMVSSPPSLKRTRTSKVLGEKGFEINWGKWSLFSVPRMSYPSKYNKVVQFCGEQQLCISSQA